MLPLPFTTSCPESPQDWALGWQVWVPRKISNVLSLLVSESCLLDCEYFNDKPEQRICWLLRRPRLVTSPLGQGHLVSSLLVNSITASLMPYKLSVLQAISEDSLGQCLQTVGGNLVGFKISEVVFHRLLKSDVEESRLETKCISCREKHPLVKLSSQLSLYLSMH